MIILIWEGELKNNRQDVDLLFDSIIRYNLQLLLNIYDSGQIVDVDLTSNESSFAINKLKETSTNHYTCFYCGKFINGNGTPSKTIITRILDDQLDIITKEKLLFKVSGFPINGLNYRLCNINSTYGSPTGFLTYNYRICMYDNSVDESKVCRCALLFIQYFISNNTINSVI